MDSFSFLGWERGKKSFGGSISIHTKLLGSLAGPGFTAMTSLNSYTTVFPLSPTSANLLVCQYDHAPARLIKSN